MRRQLICCLHLLLLDCGADLLGGCASSPGSLTCSSSPLLGASAAASVCMDDEPAAVAPLQMEVWTLQTFAELRQVLIFAIIKISWP